MLRVSDIPKKILLWEIITNEEIKEDWRHLAGSVRGAC